ncbi:pentatricopeptide repeat-containing protein At5g40400 isoform X2 [Tripterygium wilfordii]|uniref:pentatricopeptide repeat-containing protein At5g40400 isoform X2 n=1 Tax=Tripterygium wilfordii TaxID=458696 RepID=UPI0018F8237B|nr:pentatricopeptide repeat-containing protein At5g40400 isoform X2 [Tripterygium wilfordii]
MIKASRFTITQILRTSTRPCLYFVRTTSEPSLNAFSIPKSAFSSPSYSSLVEIIPDSESNSLSNPLLHFLPQTQNPNNIVNLVCSALKQGHSGLVLLQNDIKEILPHLGPREVSRALLRCQSDPSMALTLFNWVKIDLGIKPTTHNYCLVVHILAWSRKLSEAMKVLTELVVLARDHSPGEDIFKSLVLYREDCNWDPVIFDMLIKAYVKVGMIEEGFKTFRKTLEGKLREAHQLLHQMIHRGMDPDIVSYNTLVFAYCKDGKMQESRSLLLDMIGYGIDPDHFTCHVIVEGYWKQGKLLSALNLIVELQRFGVSISSDTYDYLLVSLCQEDRPFAARSLLARISQDGYVPKLEIFNELIESFCKCDCVMDAILLKAEMVSANVKPNLTTYRALISCLCRISKSKEAESLMVEMLENGMHADSFICRVLICGYCKERDTKKAELLLKFFSKEFQIFDTESYNAVLRNYCEVGDVPRVMELQERMLKLGFAPNSVSCKYMIHGLCKAMELDED